MYHTPILCFPCFWLLADEETFSSRTFSVCTGVEAAHKNIPATSQLISRSKLLWMSDREVEFVSYFRGQCPERACPGLCQDPPLHTGPFPSSRLLPAGSVTIGIIKNWLPQTVPWLTCIIEPESVGNLPRVKEAERNTLWLWASFSETSHTHTNTHKCHSYT